MNLRSLYLLILWIGLAPLFPLAAQESPLCLLAWSMVDGGGGASTGGDFSLASSIGQPGTGSGSGGDYAVSDVFGLIPVVPEPPVPPPPLVLALQINVLDGAVVISWPGDGSERVLLEETMTLPNETSWVSVDATPQSDAGRTCVRVSLSPGCRFYRLRKP
jgi:hypothetical protein